METDYQTFEIEKNSISVYTYLKENGFSESYIKKIRNNSKSLKLNNIFVNTRTKVQKGDTLKVAKNLGNPTKIKISHLPIEVLYEDENILAINKPHNLATMPTRSHFSDNLGARVLNYLNNPSFVLRIINRLDKDTAGIVIIAKNLLTYNKVLNFKKEYYAICEGITPENQTIDLPIKTISENGINQMKRVVSKDGKKATTHFLRVSHTEKHSLIKLHLETGRTHQIRVHLSHIGYPLLGDGIYSENKQKLPHTFLCLKKVSFEVEDIKISLEVDLPSEWNQFIK